MAFGFITPVLTVLVRVLFVASGQGFHYSKELRLFVFYGIWVLVEKRLNMMRPGSTDVSYGWMRFMIF